MIIKKPNDDDDVPWGLFLLKYRLSYNVGRPQFSFKKRKKKQFI